MRSVQQKLDLFRACFSGLPHAYGTYDPRTGDVRQVKQPVTDRVLLDHLRGRQPYGVYLLLDDRTRAVVADFDADDSTLPLALLERARQLAIPGYLERSRRKGWHVWVFLSVPGLDAARIRAFMRRLLDDIGAPQTEIFPKQDRLGTRNRFGNFINAPLFGGLVLQGRTVFVDPASLEPYRDQWAFLAAIQRVSDLQLEQLAVQLRIGSLSSLPAPLASGGSILSKTFGLAPCAQRMLSEGVTANQRVACFRLAVHLKKAGIPGDIAVASLQAWALKNRPADGKRILTPHEVEGQVEAAYGKDYRGCGCEHPAVRPFCDHACPLRRGENAVESRIPKERHTACITQQAAR